MTVSEAIEKLKNMRLFMRITDKNSEHKFAEDDYKANEIAIQALERKKPKKITEIHIDEYICPSCGEENSGCDDRKITDKYCPNCGQRLEV